MGILGFEMEVACANGPAMPDQTIISAPDCSMQSTALTEFGMCRVASSLPRPLWRSPPA